MGGTVKNRRKKKYKYNVNRKRLNKNSKKLPRIDCEPLRRAWDRKKSVMVNFRAMGLACNVNKSLAIPNYKQELLPGEDENAGVNEEFPKSFVIDELEEVVNVHKEKTLRLPVQEARFCVHMMERYGDNYKDMARDEKNYYQLTPKQIRKKIMKFKSIKPQYNAYLKAKGEGEVVDDDE